MKFNNDKIEKWMSKIIGFLVALAFAYLFFQSDIVNFIAVFLGAIYVVIASIWVAKNTRSKNMDNKLKNLIEKNFEEKLDMLKEKEKNSFILNNINFNIAHFFGISMVIMMSCIILFPLVVFFAAPFNPILGLTIILPFHFLLINGIKTVEKVKLKREKLHKKYFKKYLEEDKK